jgi:hypothetical protein
MKVGDIVYYKKDWKGKRPWYLYSISKGDLCTIVLMKDGKITNGKNGQERLNASIVNLNISDIELYE